MNFSRRRNLFTLGDFHQNNSAQNQIKAQLRRRTSDLFERDPFKIQSYNFHYADRPAYPLQGLVNRALPSPLKPFETYYYNNDFAFAGNDKENPSTNKFHEHRRRKFLHDQFQQSTPTSAPFHASTRRQQTAARQHHCNHSAEGATALSTTSTATTYGTGGNRGVRNSSTVCGSQYRDRNVGPSSATLNVSAHKTGSASTYYRWENQSDDLQRMRSSLAFCPQAGSSWEHQQQQQQKLQQPACRPRSPYPSLQRYVYPRKSHTSISANDESASDLCDLKTHKTDDVFSVHSGCSPVVPPPYKHVVRELQNPRASASEHSCRPALQPIQLSNKSSLMSPLSHSHSTCSGCQININIKRLDDKSLNENVTIEIDGDKSGNSVHNYNPRSSSNLRPKRAKHTTTINNLSDKSVLFDMTENDSVNTFVIDKRLSKYDLKSEKKEVTSLRGRDRERSIATLRHCGTDKKLAEKTRDHSVNKRVNPKAGSLPIFRRPFSDVTINAKELQHEHSKLPKSRNHSPSLGPVSSRPDESQKTPSHRDSINLMHNVHINAALKDARNLRRASEKKVADMLNQPSSSNSLFKHSGVKFNDRLEPKRYDPLLSSRLMPSSTSSSRLSLSGRKELGEKRSACSLSSSACNLQFDPKRSPIAKETSRHSLCPSPLNVNINVYTDKLKLLRV